MDIVKPMIDDAEQAVEKAGDHTIDTLSSAFGKLGPVIAGKKLRIVIEVTLEDR